MRVLTERALKTESSSLHYLSLTHKKDPFIGELGRRQTLAADQRTTVSPSRSPPSSMPTCRSFS